jgi:50S ribosomal protein L16 3-hydroxylase
MNAVAMGYPLGGMPVDDFLRDYWQKKPCLIRQAFPNFIPELDENDIAGLACEELAESRLVLGSFEAANWTVEHGPFQEQRLAKLPERDWCLLVQDVEKHYPPLQALLTRFAFLPRWRLDDLMVSVSGPGGSVGPHVDQYDVFLLQASGQRRWQISEHFNPACLANSDLRVLQEFTSEQEWLLEAGDMLYLPPGIAHYGLALDLGMTWSIGLRAPSQADLFQALGDWLAERHQEGQRFTDPNLAVTQRHGEISPQALQRLASLFSLSTLPAADLNEFLGSFISRFRLAHQPAAPDTQLTLVELKDALRSGCSVQSNPWTRLSWIAQGEQARFFAAGESLFCSTQLATQLCGPEPAELRLTELDEQDQNCVLELLNLGHLYLQGALD